MRKKRVLLLSEGFGTGHTQAAHALAVSLKKNSRDVLTKVIELGGFLHPTITPWIIGAYRRAVISRPKLVGKVYRSQYNKSINRLTQLVLHRFYYKQTTELIRQLRPDTVVCTHPFPNIIISRLKRLGLNVPLCTVITDYDAHGTWVSPEVDKYLVSTENVKQKLLARGIPDTKIEVTGIPVHPNFWEQHNKAEIRARFRLREMPTVLVMGGGWGVIKNEEMLIRAANWRDRIQLIFCLGSNEKFRAKLAEQEIFRHPNIHMLGFTKNIDQLMEVSDLLITKPGGMTCTEALTKGVPMLFYNPIPGQEEENCQYFTERGFGFELKKIEDVDHWFRLLLEQYSEFTCRRAKIAQAVSKYNPNRCSKTIMEFLK
ncbi:MAG TPA: glycosyltransferase [Bacilli bacterium]